MPLERLALSVAVLVLLWSPLDGHAATYYVRQTVGDDTNDGLSPKTAWHRISKLSSAMHAGDTAFVGPGLYRDGIYVEHDGTVDKRIIFIGDPTGQHTGDPPGAVMISGSEPVDGNAFKPHSAPGVYVAELPASGVHGVVEMDGPQYRYLGVTQTKEYLSDKTPPVDIVASLPSSYYHDEAAKVLYIHTSDGRPPAEHEMELIRRGNGIHIIGKHYITVIGFTFRHMADAGISFFKGSSDGVAIGNTAYGSRQGIRVYGAKNILVYGNTLFRNENSGVYFAAESVNGLAIGNTAYENVKGVRWSSQSANAIAIDNRLFDNSEAGISIEHADHAVVRSNRVARNKKTQLLVLESEYSSEENCFELGGPGELVADFSPFPFSDRFGTLADYRRTRRQDLHSREGSCGPLPEKIDVMRLHRDSMSYVERARESLGRR